MAENFVKIRTDGSLYIVETGYQTRDDIRRLNERVLKEAKRLHAIHKPVLILADLSRITGHDRGSEAEAVATLRVPFDSMAIYAPSRADRLLINTLVILHNSRDRIRTFKTLKEAEDWLAGYK